MASRWVSSLLLLPIGLLVGCQYFDRVKECRALADAVNPTLHWVETERSLHPESSTTYRLIAARYDAASASLTQLSQKRHVPNLAGDYQILLRDAARDARIFAEALDSRDPFRMTSARVNASRNTKREAQLVARINATCAPR